MLYCVKPPGDLSFSTVLLLLSQPDDFSYLGARVWLGVFRCVWWKTCRSDGIDCETLKRDGFIPFDRIFMLKNVHLEL